MNAREFLKSADVSAGDQVLAEKVIEHLIGLVRPSAELDEFPCKCVERAVRAFIRERQNRLEVALLLDHDVMIELFMIAAYINSYKHQ